MIALLDSVSLTLLDSQLCGLVVRAFACGAW